MVFSFLTPVRLVRIESNHVLSLKLKRFDSDLTPVAFFKCVIFYSLSVPQVSQSSLPSQPYVEVRPKIMTIGPSFVPSVNVIHVGDRPQVRQQFDICQNLVLDKNKQASTSKVHL